MHILVTVRALCAHRLAASALFMFPVLAQPIAAVKDPREEMLKKALHTVQDSPLEIPLSITISFFPSAHPESKLVIRFSDRAQAEVESVQASVTSGAALLLARRAASADIADAVALMRVKRKRFHVDPKIAGAWLTDFQTTVPSSLDEMIKGAFEHLVQLDGTVYELSYRGASDQVRIRVSGCEVDTDCSHDIPLVQWIDKVRKKVKDMIAGVDK